MNYPKITLALSLLICFHFSFGQKKQEPETVAKAPAATTIDSKVTGMKKYVGYFEFYYDEKTDKIHLVIDKLNQEFLYVESLAAGIGSNDIGLDRNQLGKERVVKFEKRGTQVL